MVPFRPFTTDDYPALAELWRLAWDEPRTAASLQAADADVAAPGLQVRLVVEQDGRPVLIGGYSETPWSPAPDKYFLSCFVHSAYQGRGLGSSWYRHVTAELEGRGARLLTATTRDDLPVAVGFLERRDFRLVIREPESRLDVATFDPAPFAGRAHVAGISILSLPEVQRRDPAWTWRCWELEWAVWHPILAPTSGTMPRGVMSLRKSR